MGRTFAVLLLASTIISLAALFQSPLFRSIWLEVDEPRNHVIEMHPSSPEFPAMLARTKAKEVVARDVIAGRVSLVEAAAHFKQIEQCESPDHLVLIPGCSYDEKLCRQVILYVRDVEGQTKAGDEVSSRLERELTHRLASKNLLK